MTVTLLKALALAAPLWGADSDARLTTEYHFWNALCADNLSFRLAM